MGLSVAARDNSGIRVHFTEELRQYDGGVMTVGTAVTPLHLIPPRQPAYATAGYCTDECTSKVSAQPLSRNAPALCSFHFFLDFSLFVCSSSVLIS